MDRWQWVDAFRNAGIDTPTLMNMSEEDFKKCSMFLIDSGLAPLSYWPKPKKSAEEEELDRIIEEANKLKMNKGNNTGYRFNENSVKNNITDQKFDVNNAHSEEEEKKEEEKNKKKQDLGPRSYVWSEDNEAEANRVILDQQEVEYNRLLQEELKRQEEEQKQHLENMKQNMQEHNQIANQIQQKRNNMDKYQILGAEPEKGIQLAILMPNNHRILRRFDIDKSADDVFTVVEGQEEMYDNKDSLMEYRIQYGLNEELQRNKTLKEQGITKKTLLSVILE